MYNRLPRGVGQSKNTLFSKSISGDLIFRVRLHRVAVLRSIPYAAVRWFPSGIGMSSPSSLPTGTVTDSDVNFTLFSHCDQNSPSYSPSLRRSDPLSISLSIPSSHAYSFRTHLTRPNSHSCWSYNGSNWHGPWWASAGGIDFLYFSVCLRDCGPAPLGELFPRLPSSAFSLALLSPLPIHSAIFFIVRVARSFHLLHTFSCLSRIPATSGLRRLSPSGAITLR